MRPLSGKVAVVTGGGRGVGRATVLALAEQGAKVCVAARTATEIEPVADEARAVGVEAIAVPADVTRADDVDRLIRYTVATLGPLDILVNNAGSFPVGPIHEFEEQEWDEAVAIDLKSFYLCTRAALRQGGMLERSTGHIVNVGSVSVRRQVPGMSVHCALKAGLLGLSESLRRELAPSGVRVSLVCPATINTSLVQSEQARSYVHGSDKWLEPDDVADLIVYCATRRRGVNISEATLVGL